MYLICGQLPAGTKIIDWNLYNCTIQRRLARRECAHHFGDRRGDATFLGGPQQHQLSADIQTQIACQHRADKSFTGSAKVAARQLHIR